jgi:drug/metabolite transporter (DMT)-like permease
VTRYRDALLFVGLAVAWGGSFVAIEIGLTDFPPVLLAAFRFYLGAATLLAYVLVRDDDPWPRTRGDAVGILAGGVLLVAANSVFLFVGQQYTTGGVAAVVYSLVPVLTAGFAALLLGNVRLTALDVLGIVVGLVGVALVADPDLTALADGSATGELLVLAAVVSVSLGSVLVQRSENTCSPLSLTAWAMAVGSVVTHLVSIALGEPFDVTAGIRPLVALVFLGVAASAVGYGIYFTLLDRLGSLQINLVSYVVPVVAAIAGWLLIDERLPPSALVGFLVIFVGFLLVKRRALRDELGTVFG